MNVRVQQHIAERLSLQPPQTESLAKLAQALYLAPQLLHKEKHSANQTENQIILETLMTEFPTLTTNLGNTA